MSWSTAPTAPARKYGPGWATAPPAAGTVVKGGWYTLLERIGASTGSGQLGAVLEPRNPLHRSFSGGGTLTVALQIRNTRAAAFNSTGVLRSSAGIFRVVDSAAALGGAGTLTAAINDGLSAIVTLGAAATLGGTGTLQATLDGGAAAIDGLSASMLVLCRPAFNGDGQLAIGLVQIQTSAAGLTATGILSAELLGGVPFIGLYATMAPRYTFPAPWTAAGALTAGWMQIYFFAPLLAASGALTAVTSQIYQITGAGMATGTLTGVMLERYAVTGSATGTGALTATVSQIMPVTAPFTASGSLTATATAQYASSVGFTGAGTLTAATSIILTSSTALTGTGSLSGDVYGIVPSPAALSGAGALTADAHGASAGVAAADLIGTGALTATAIESHEVVGSMAGTGTTTAMMSQIYTPAAALAGAGTLSAATPVAVYTSSAALTGDGTLTATAVKVVPVAFDAVGAGDTSVTAITNGGRLSWSHTATGTNRCVIVVIQVQHDSGHAAYTAHTRTVTYGGNAMTSLGGVHDNNITGATGCWHEWFYLLNPPTGAQTIQVDVVKTSTTGWYMGAKSASYTSVTSVGTLQTSFGTETGTALSQTITSAANRRVCGYFQQFSSPAITSYNQTSRWSIASDANGAEAAVFGDAAGAASVTFTAVRATGVDYSESALELIP